MKIMQDILEICVETLCIYSDKLTSNAEVTGWLTLYFIIDLQYNHPGRWLFIAVLWTLLKLPPSFSHLPSTQRNMHNTKIFVKLWPGAGSILWTTCIYTTVILNNLFLVKLVIIQVFIEHLFNISLVLSFLPESYVIV